MSWRDHLKQQISARAADVGVRPKIMTNLGHLFSIRPDITFLNHGSFGACPAEVFEVYQQWQRELETQPVEFIGRRGEALLGAARQELAAYLGTAAENLVFVTNATIGLNTIARSLRLREGDEILTTNHEYGALEKMWSFMCARRGCKIIQSSLPLPVESSERLVEAIWQGVSPRTKVLFVSHITSPTALTLPLRSLVARAREQNIVTVIDGAHGPGQLTVNLDDLNVDFYVGNCHKWMMAPKGAAFLYAHPNYQSQLEPLVVSWGWHTDRSRVSYLVDCLEYQGTRDISAFLTVPAAIGFMEKYGWETVRADCYRLITDSRDAILAITGKPPICPEGSNWYQQMAAFWLPEIDGQILQQRLYNEFSIEVPVTSIGNDQFLRISVQGYNSPGDIEKLVTALGKLLPEVGKRET